MEEHLTPSKSRPATPKAASKTCRGKSDSDDATCQVPGCTVLLSTQKVYNQRCRVCQEHLVASVVDFNGVSKRFCQQCARFQELEEFDGVKRSCRVRLERHKLQRRKRKGLSAVSSEADGGLNCARVQRGLDASDLSPGGKPMGWSGFSRLGDERPVPSAIRRNETGAEVQQDLKRTTQFARPNLKDEPAVAIQQPSLAQDVVHESQRLCTPGFADPTGGASFMDSLLRRLHEGDSFRVDEPPPSGGGGIGPDERAGGFDSAGGAVEADALQRGPSFSARPRDWSLPTSSQTHEYREGQLVTSMLPFESVGDLGFRNVQECIEGLSSADKLPLGEPAPSGPHGLADAAQHRGPPSRHDYAAAFWPPQESLAKLARTHPAFMESIMRVLHESGEADAILAAMPWGAADHRDDPPSWQLGAFRGGHVPADPPRGAMQSQPRPF